MGQLAELLIHRAFAGLRASVNFDAPAMNRFQLCFIALCVAGSSFAQDYYKGRQRFDDDWRFHEVKLPRPVSDIPEWQWSPIDKVDTNSSTLFIFSGLTAPAKPGDDVFHGRRGFALFRATLRHDFAKGDPKVLHFDSVDDNGTVYLNGKRLLHHEGWSDPFDVPLNGWLDGQDNQLAVVVENTGGRGGIAAVRYLQPAAENRFPEAGEGFDDRPWRHVHLPHDFVIEGKFSPDEDPGHGSLPKNIGWYRKHFVLPAGAARQSVWLDFEGAFSDAHLWLNGHFLGSHRSGYTGFRFDLNKYAHFGGENVIAVRCDSSKTEGWWYEGGGLYRHVWLTRTNDLHVAPLGGIYVTSQISGMGSKSPHARVEVAVTLEGADEHEARCGVEVDLVQPDGTVVAWGNQDLIMNRKKLPLRYALDIPKPHLWSLESPYLYTAKVKVFSFDLVAEAQTHFGIRTIKFDPDQGFLLNGKQVKLKGTCNHQDFAGVGIGMPDSILEWRIKKLKAMGSNAYRCSHNEVSPALLDACDRLGMLVMDENREFGDTWTGKASQNTTTNDLSDLRQEVLRDRNHPCVIMWSLANEEFGVQSTPAGGRIGRALYDAVKQLDDTRPITAALNGGHGSYFSKVLDLEGFNYGPGEYEPYHKAHPDHPMFASETASTLTDRGEYASDKEHGYVPAYDIEGSNTAEDAWEPIAEEPYNAGGFVWTGFDYKGEPTPYNWPCVNSHFGIMDICGFPKDNYYYYLAWWGGKPVIHIEPHWNWAGKEGRPIKVWAFTNGDEAELFLNGKSLGRKTAPAYRHVEWTVPSEPGTLSAVAYQDGKECAHDSVSTTGEPAAIVATTSTDVLYGDGEACMMIEVSVVDAEGRVVPTASDLIKFSVIGPATVVGVGNGDPSCHEPDRASQRHAFNGRCLGIVQSIVHGDGDAVVTLSSPGLKSATIRRRVRADLERR